MVLQTFVAQKSYLCHISLPASLFMLYYFNEVCDMMLSLCSHLVHWNSFIWGWFCHSVDIYTRPTC